MVVIGVDANLILATIAPVVDNWTSTHPAGAKLLETYRAILADLKSGK